jgi:DNA-directed RNA polymerase specialized sigma24 family protein
VSKKQNYWGDEQEQAFIVFAKSKGTTREICYNRFLKGPLVQMFQSIFARYFQNKIGNLQEEEVKTECITKVLIKADKFKAERAKAFSFCQTVIKNYLTDLVKKAKREQGKYVQFEEETFESETSYTPDFEFFDEEEEKDFLYLKHINFRNRVSILIEDYLAQEGYNEEVKEAYLNWFYDRSKPNFKQKGYQATLHLSIHNKLLKCLEKDGVLTAEELQRALEWKKKKR